MTRTLRIFGLALTLTSCSTVPSGPSALVLPSTQKNQSQFRADDTECRKFAHTQLATTPDQPHSLEEGQLHFDIDYLQCMYGKGHLIPVPGEVISDKYPPVPPSAADSFASPKP